MKNSLEKYVVRCQQIGYNIPCSALFEAFLVRSGNMLGRG
jgi:hypothetical protein